MSEERKKILEMVAAKKITIEEAEKLLAALREPNSTSTPTTSPKYLRVRIEPAPGNDQGERVNVRVPFSLVRAGLKFASFIPVHAQDKINAHLKEQGVPFDLSHFNPQDIEELIHHLHDLSVEIEGKEQVRIYCE